MSQVRRGYPRQLIIKRVNSIVNILRKEYVCLELLMFVDDKERGIVGHIVDPAAMLKLLNPGDQLALVYVGRSIVFIWKADDSQLLKA